MVIDINLAQVNPVLPDSDTGDWCGGWNGATGAHTNHQQLLSRGNCQVNIHQHTGLVLFQKSVKCSLLINSNNLDLI